MEALQMKLPSNKSKTNIGLLNPLTLTVME